MDREMLSAMLADAVTSQTQFSTRYRSLDDTDKLKHHYSMAYWQLQELIDELRLRIKAAEDAEMRKRYNMPPNAELL